MKKMNLITISTITLFIGTTGGLNVQAEDISTTSIGEVSFVLPEEEAPAITAPEDGGVIDPEDGGNGTTGPLRIDHASHVRFGEHEVSSNNEIYKALLNSHNVDGVDKYLSTFAQVTDNRGTNEGWELSIRATTFVTTVSGVSKELENAQLKINQVPNITNNYNYDVSTVPNPNSNQQNIINSTAVLASANKNQGMGQWHITLGETGTFSEQLLNEAITLEVPGRSATLPGQTYRSTLTWTLTDSI